MIPDSVVGVRVDRSGPIQFVYCAFPDLDRAIRVIVEADGKSYLAFVALPSRLLLRITNEAIHGRITSAGEDAPEVAAAVTKLECEAVDMAGHFAGAGVRFVRARWSVDLARVTLAVELADPTAVRTMLPSIRDALASQLRSEVCFQTPDGQPLELPSLVDGREGFAERRSRS